MGDVEVTIRAVDDTKQAVDSASGNFQKLGKATKELSAANAKTADEFTRLGGDFRQLKPNLDDYIGKLNAATPANMRFAAAADKVGTAFENGSMSAKDASRALQDIRAQMDAARPASEKLAEGFKSFSRGATIAVAAVTAEIMIMKKIMDFGKEGAMLEYTRDKFDRLAASIGTTGDALEKDLRGAVRGMMSDAEMFASASDLMSLGLAKTHGEAVRLTKVAAALGMNMNQLVLTLTNQTTMRFDALGVSVDGFEEKVSKLKAAGIGANEAFRMAFLEQAEGQLARVGDIADTDVGSFIRLEAATKNLGDAVKRDLAPFLADAAEAAYNLLTWSDRLDRVMSNHAETVSASGVPYAEYAAELKRAAEAAGYSVNAEGELIATRRYGSSILREVVQVNYLLTESEYAAAKATEDTSKAQEKALTYSEQFAKSMQGTAYSVKDMSAATKDLVNSMSDVPNLMDDIANKGGKVMDAYSQLADAQKQLSDAAKDYGQSTGNEVADLLEQRLGPNSQRYKQALDDIDAAMGTNLQGEYEHKKALEDIAKAYADTGDQEAFRANLQALAGEELPAVTAELEQAVLDAKNLTRELLELPEFLQVEINVKATGDLDILGYTPKPEIKTPPPGVYNNQHATGTNGWLTVPPGYPNDSYTVGLTSGERYNVTRAGQDKGEGGGRGMVFNNYGTLVFEREQDMVNTILMYGVS